MYKERVDPSCPCSLQGGWTRSPLKVPSNPNYSMILCLKELDHTSIEPFVRASKHTCQVQSQGVFKFLTSQRKTMHRFGVCAQNWVLFANVGCDVENLVIKVCPNPPQPPHLLQASADLHDQFACSYQRRLVTGWGLSWQTQPSISASLLPQSPLVLCPSLPPS